MFILSFYRSNPEFTQGSQLCLLLCFILCLLSCQAQPETDKQAQIQGQGPQSTTMTDILVESIDTQGDSFCIDTTAPQTNQLRHGPTNQDARYFDVGLLNEAVHEEPYLKLGTGRGAYQSIQDGDTLTVVKGIQGGYHVWGAFVGKCIPFQEVEITFQLKDGDRLLAQANYTESILYLNEAEEFEYSAVTVIYLNNDDVLAHVGKTLDLSVRVNQIAQPEVYFEDHKRIITNCCQ
jgi:hypothetical protein